MIPLTDVKEKIKSKPNFFFAGGVGASLWVSPKPSFLSATRQLTEGRSALDQSKQPESVCKAAKLDCAGVVIVDNEIKRKGQGRRKTRQTKPQNTKKNNPSLTNKR